jgi:RNA polymerase sigma factor for flagellar operon FliA
MSSKLPVNLSQAQRDERDQRITQYTPLVRYVISRLAIKLPNVLDYDDIMSFGTIGLIEAIDRYDDSKGVKFETYAISRVRGAIIDAMRGLDRLPRSVRQKARRIDAAVAELSQELARRPTEAELAEHLDITIEQYRKAMVDTSWVTVSLDIESSRDDEQDGTSMDAMLSDPNVEDFSDSLARRETLAEVVDSLRSLPERERVLLSLYYKEGLTMREIAGVLTISESRVCQLHSRALSRLRTQMTGRMAA